MAYKTVVAGSLYSQIIELLRSSAAANRAFSLAMLVPSETGLSGRWNLVVSAPWIDDKGLTSAIPTITSALQQFLSKNNVQQIERVSVLPTTDLLVKELIVEDIRPGTAYKVQAFPLTARGIEDAVILAAQNPASSQFGYVQPKIRTRA
jgi:hypothetical protein